MPSSSLTTFASYLLSTTFSRALNKQSRFWCLCENCDFPVQPRRGGLNLAQDVSPGNTSSNSASPAGTAETAGNGFSRPSRTTSWANVSRSSGTELVEPGRPYTADLSGQGNSCPLWSPLTLPNEPRSEMAAIQHIDGRVLFFRMQASARIAERAGPSVARCRSPASLSIYRRPASWD